MIDPQAIPKVKQNAQINPIVSITFKLSFPDLGARAIKEAVQRPLVIEIKAIFTKGNHSLSKRAPSFFSANIDVAINANLKVTITY